MTIVFVGIDLAKNIFAVHGAGEAGKAELVRPSVAREKLHELVAALPPCVIGMEACSGAHHWARLFAASGHTVRLIAPKFVTPHRMSGRRDKNDAADSLRTEQAYVQWMRTFVKWHGLRHPRNMGREEIKGFLPMLANERRVGG